MELYYSRSFEEVTVQQILWFWLRLSLRRADPAKLPVTSMRAAFRCRKVIHRLRMKEIKHRISMPVREMDFSLAAPVFRVKRVQLKGTGRFRCSEGDLVRVLRMTIQFLRTLVTKYLILTFQTSFMRRCCL